MRRRRLRSLIARFAVRAGLPATLVEVGLIAAIATGLFVAMETGGAALLHSRNALPTHDSLQSPRDANRIGERRSNGSGVLTPPDAVLHLWLPLRPARWR
jgi:hypothetical protein